jgi:hypothetical protein
MSVATSHVQSNAVGSDVQPPHFGEVCDRESDCPAKPLVAVEMMAGRMTFCGHHFRELPESMTKLFLGVLDTSEWKSET